VIFGAKIVAALVLAIVQCTLWSMLLRLNRITIQNLGLVLLLALLAVFFSMAKRLIAVPA